MRTISTLLALTFAALLVVVACAASPPLAPPVVYAVEDTAPAGGVSLIFYDDFEHATTDWCALHDEPIGSTPSGCECGLVTVEWPPPINYRDPRPQWCVGQPQVNTHVDCWQCWTPAD